MERRLILVALGFSVWIQPALSQTPTDRVRADLLSLNPSSAARLADDIMLLAENNHPSRASLRRFTDNLSAALAGKTLAESSVKQIADSLRGVMQSAGVSTLIYQRNVTDFQNVLEQLGVGKQQRQTLAEQLAGIGKQVRGPDDTPVRAPAARR